MRKARRKVTGEAAAGRLKAYLKGAGAEPMRWLVRLWGDQGSAVSYAELREAILRGSISPGWIATWQRDYARYVSERLAPAWEAAMREGNVLLEAARPAYAFDYASLAVQRWVTENGARLVTGMVREQTEALKAMIRRGTSGYWTVDELATSMRPLIGLTKPQAVANLNYESRVRDALLKKNPGMRPETAAKKAREAALKYAGRQHRYRADTIATTELAYAHNWGQEEGIRQAQAEGLLGPVEAIWSTARDELACDACGAREGQAVDELPPAHPRCRCVKIYRELGPPRLPEAGDRGIIETTEERRDMGREVFFGRLDAADNYSPAYKEKLKQVYDYFFAQGFLFNEHALGRVIGQKRGRGKRAFTQEEILDVLRQAPNYTQDGSKWVRHYANIAVIQAMDDGSIVSIVVRENPSDKWEVLT